MAHTEMDAAAYVDLMAGVMKLEIKTTWHRAVADNVLVAASMAELVEGFPLADDVEPAPVYEVGR